MTGDNALFSDILIRSSGEKMTYPVPTYEALKNILHSIYWKPTLIWVVASVRIMKRIQTERKNELVLNYTNKAGNNRDRVFVTYLKDVTYQVRAHFEWNMNRPALEADRKDGKHYNIAKRMIERGGRRDVFLGKRECQAYVEPCVFGEGAGFYDNSGDIPLGVMLHGITYADEAILQEDMGMDTVRLWMPVMKNGVIDFIRPEECVSKRHIRMGKIKPFGEEYGNFTGCDEAEKEVTQ